MSVLPYQTNKSRYARSDIVSCIPDVLCEMYSLSESTCVICFSSRFRMTSWDLWQETRTPFLRISCWQWSVSSQWLACVWAHCGIRAHLMHPSQQTAHTTALCPSIIMFVFMCVSSHTPSVCILSIDGARCGVLWLAGHRQPLYDCQLALHPAA